MSQQHIHWIEYSTFFVRFLPLFTHSGLFRSSIRFSVIYFCIGLMPTVSTIYTPLSVLLCDINLSTAMKIYLRWHCSMASYFSNAKHEHCYSIEPLKPFLQLEIYIMQTRKKWGSYRKRLLRKTHWYWVRSNGTFNFLHGAFYHHLNTN